jgi:hypothetical protein
MTTPSLRDAARAALDVFDGLERHLTSGEAGRPEGREAGQALRERAKVATSALRAAFATDPEADPSLDGMVTIERLRLQPGDTLLLMHDRPMPRGTAERIIEGIEGLFGRLGVRVPVIILDDGLKPAVLNVAGLMPEPTGRPIRALVEACEREFTSDLTERPAEMGGCTAEEAVAEGLSGHGAESFLTFGLIREARKALDGHPGGLDPIAAAVLDRIARIGENRAQVIADELAGQLQVEPGLIVDVISRMIDASELKRDTLSLTLSLTRLGRARHEAFGLGRKPTTAEES